MSSCISDKSWLLDLTGNSHKCQKSNLLESTSIKFQPVCHKCGAYSKVHQCGQPVSTTNSRKLQYSKAV